MRHFHVFRVESKGAYWVTHCAPGDNAADALKRLREREPKWTPLDALYIVLPSAGFGNTSSVRLTNPGGKRVLFRIAEVPKPPVDIEVTEVRCLDSI